MDQMRRTERLQDTDGWLLATLKFIGRPAQRGEVINVGDFLNRSVFTNQEIDSGIRRLQMAGFAWHKDGKYCITDLGKKFVLDNGGRQIKGAISLMIHLMKVVKGMEVSGEVEESEERPHEHKFESSDAWLLLTLCEIGKPARFDEIDKAGKGNGAYFTEPQITGGLQRLRSAGLAVTVNSSMSSITAQGRDLIDRHADKDEWIVTIMGVSEELMNQNG